MTDSQMAVAGTASRRLVFRERTDLSDVSPLSPSTEEDDETHPPVNGSPKNVTPLTGMRCLSSLSLESPVRVYSEGHTKVRGIRSLQTCSPSEIPASRFYGSKTEPRNPSKSWLKDVVPKAKMQLFMDDLPNNKKRARTSSGQKVQPAPKRIRRERTVTAKRTLAFVPRLGQKAPMKKMKKKSPESKEVRSVSPLSSSSIKPKCTQRKKTSKPSVSYKEYEGEDNDYGSWNITFTKSQNNDKFHKFDVSKKFFKSPSGSKRIESKVFLTPPSSINKKKRLCHPDLMYLSPVKSETTIPLWSSPRRKLDSPVKATDSPRATKVSPLHKETRPSPRKSPRKVSESPRKRAMISAAREMVKDIEEMMEEGHPETACDIKNLLSNLSDEIAGAQPSLEDLSTALPSPDEEPGINGHDGNEEKKKLFPVFQPGHGNRKTLDEANSPKSKSNVINKRRSKLMGLGDDQYQIDNGQKGLCEMTCPGCGLFYSKGCPEDEVLHQKFHNSKSLLTYQGWKKERVVGLKGLDKVICVQPGDPKAWWNKVQSIVTLVDDLLGFPPVKLEEAKSPIVYLYVSEGQVVGCLVIEEVHTGYRFLTGDVECGVDKCDDEPHPVIAGISRIWVHPNARRLRIATSLVNSFRGNYSYGIILRKEDIAVSVPTDEGKKFFAQYMGYSNYFVYL